MQSIVILYRHSARVCLSDALTIGDAFAKRGVHEHRVIIEHGCFHYVFNIDVVAVVFPFLVGVPIEFSVQFVVSNNNNNANGSIDEVINAHCDI